MPYTIVAISGSLRTKSRNTAVLNSFVRIAPELGLNVFKYDISFIPMFSEDLEASGSSEPFPSEVMALRQSVLEADAVLLCTPENNFLPSAPMKNALDWLSRGGSTSPLANKVIAITSAGGMSGGSSAQETLRMALGKMSWLKMKVIEPTIKINLFDGTNRFDEDNNLTDSTTLESVRNICQTLSETLSVNRDLQAAIKNILQQQ
jgi:chromate reductase